MPWGYKMLQYYKYIGSGENMVKQRQLPCLYGLSVTLGLRGNLSPANLITISALQVRLERSWIKTLQSFKGKTLHSNSKRWPDFWDRKWGFLFKNTLGRVKKMVKSVVKKHLITSLLLLLNYCHYWQAWFILGIIKSMSVLISRSRADMARWQASRKE